MFIALFSIIVAFVLFLYIIIRIWDKHSNKHSNKHYVTKIPTRTKCRTCEYYNYDVDKCWLNKNPSTCCRWEHTDDDYYLGVADD